MSLSPRNGVNRVCFTQIFYLVILATTFSLSNDPGKVDSNFFCYAATVLSPHRNALIFTHNMHKPTLRPFTQKMHLHSTLKGCIFVLKDFDQSQELKTKAKKRISLLFKLRPDFVIWKMVGKQG